MSRTLAPPISLANLLRSTPVALALCCASHLPAQQHLLRRFGAEQGLPVPPVWALAQDREGFIWVGTQVGLFRYDGIEFLRWAPERISGSVFRLASSPDGRIAAQMENGVALMVTARGATLLPTRAGGWPARSPTITFDESGRLWTLDGDGAAVCYGAHGWGTIRRQRVNGERGRVVRAAAGGGVYIGTDGGLWLLASPDSLARKRYDVRLADLASLPDGRLILLTVYGDVVELSGDRTRVLASISGGDIPHGRPIALATRSGAIWVSLDRYLVALRADGEPEVIGPEDGLESGGALLVDREGSLWMGTFTSLLQYPEPETALWTDHDGLPSLHTRFIARSGNALWVTSWQGTALVQRTKGTIAAKTMVDLFSQSRPCVDPTGVVWLSSSAGVVRIRGDRVIGRLPRRSSFNSCAPAPDGALWIGTDRGLLLADITRGTLRSIERLPFGDSATVESVYRDRRGELWVTSADHICSAPERAVPGGGANGWTCDSIPGARAITSLLQLSDGTLWAATLGAAVVARRERGEGGWRPIPAALRLPSRDIFAMSKSRSGGIWITGYGTMTRVRPGGATGWDVLETPGVGNGLPTVGGGDLLEDTDGTLWVTTALGLLQVRPRARFASDAPAPAVAVVDARVDTLSLARDEMVELPADRNRLELRFAALTYRDPARVRYQVRLAPDAPWAGARGQPSVHWADLSPGLYRAEVRASLDGVHWSPHPARFAFRVLPPWYRTSWALSLFTVLVGGVLWLVYRARLAFLLGLERQRTRIAMDLHDELGSGLGSIGILAGLLGGGRLDEAYRGRIAREVAETAEELGSALSDIVWSLDPRTATLEEVAGRLASHAERFFAGGDVKFTLRAPGEWPPARLPLALRRNLLLIGLEALHNAARHARGCSVTLAFAQRGSLWEIAVVDDGVGFGGGAPREGHRGHGVGGMRRRAEEIDASLQWRETAGGGTTVVLRFVLPGAARLGARALGARFRRRPPMA